MDLLSRIKMAAAGCGEEALSRIELDLISLKAGAIGDIAPYLESRSIRTVALAADSVTYEAAGERVNALLAKAGIETHVTIVKPNALGDVLADEAAIVQLLIDLKRSAAPVVIAVGGGTIHDIARFCAYSAGIPFLAVPTAPSVDGFNSKGAPLIIRGDKITIPAIGPDAIFADLDILTRAPRRLAAAGFGDMLGKYTSLFDWKFGAIAAGEPYDQASADITRQALLRCVNHADQIAAQEEEGIYELTVGLIESGLAMLLFGRSHPASGAEHHLSHYWETEWIRSGQRQQLHGAKVGVACAAISDLYHRLVSEGPDAWLAPTTGDDPRSDRIRSNWPDIRRAAEEVPAGAELRELLARVGGPATAEELGIGRELWDRSLREAHRIRMERFTLLRAYNESSLGK